MKEYKKEKIEKLTQRYKDGEMSKKIYDKALSLEKISTPYIFTKTKTGKIIGVVDAFEELKNERLKKKKNRL